LLLKYSNLILPVFRPENFDVGKFDKFFQHFIFDFEANLKGNPIFDLLYLGQYFGRYICKLMSSDNTVKNK